jgi:hypothetical protein
MQVRSQKAQVRRHTWQTASVLAICLLVFGLCLGASPPDSAAAPDTTAPKPQVRIIAGGPVSVSAKLLPRRGNKLTVGDQFYLELTVKHHRNTRSSEPFLTQMDPFMVLDRKSVTRYAGDTIVDVHKLKMAAFATGDLKIPPFIVTWPQDGEVLAAASDTIPLTVTSVMPKDMKDVNDLKPQVQFPNLLPLWILLCLIAAAGLSYIGWRLYRRYRRIRLYGTPLPDPWDEALSSLDAIPADNWLKAGHVKRYYYTVSEILKRYLMRRFEFPAVDQTTTEIVRALKQQKVPERDGFGDFFQRADMVKYARFVPPAPDIAAVIPAARELVNATTPKPEPSQTSPTT